MSIEAVASWVFLALAVVLCIFLIVQAGRISRIEKQLRALTRGAGPGAAAMSLADLVTAHGASLEAAKTDLQGLHGSVTSLQEAVANSVQCVGLVRYNPFGDTGGDQSFALALLDKHGDGIVVSSLHSRTATRFYAKPIKAWSSALSLSDEESQAINQANA